MLKFKVNRDPQKALDQAKDILSGKGLTGWLTKLFVGKEDLAKMNADLQQAQDMMNEVKEAERIRQNGASAKATVLAIQDTGMLLNYNPVVLLTLEVRPNIGVSYKTTVKTPVSKIAIPRIGDELPVKYDPADKTKVVLGA